MAFTSSTKSTIVRIKTAGLRSAFRVLELVSPRLGALWAERFWFAITPSRVQAVVGGGTHFEVASQGGVVRGTRWGSGPVVYLVHGWGGNSSQLGSFVAPLVAAGFSVVAHDALSHGRSDPGPTGAGNSDGVQMGKALDDVAAKFGPAHAVVAHSMGSLATGLALQHGWLGTDRLVMIAPAVRISDYVTVVQAGLGFGPRTLRRLETRVLNRVGLPIDAVDLHRVAEEIERPELLVIHDPADRETPYASTTSLVAHWSGARLTTIEGLGHRRALRDPAIIRQVVAFVSSDELQEATA
ncbi:alpha/beta fold hydrolase [Aeromicrobium panaciterrae]|uniref:alpha/beta hydrolase n=1 Tax=Aeromicrobium panaciterrae TaxID=363861 RepID=UPI0031D7B665